jgi:hypothetical protein
MCSTVASSSFGLAAQFLLSHQHDGIYSVFLINFLVATCRVVHDASQGVSRAGAKAGMDDDRTSLVREVFRVVDEASPRIVVLENVWALGRER